MRALRRSRTAAVGGLTVALLLVLSGVLAASESDGAHVLVFDNAYHDGDQDDPTTTRIEAGETVHWRWDDGNENEHTVTAIDESFDSDDECAEDNTECREAPNTFSVTFDEPGTYEYRCKNHGFSVLPEPMRGTVEVVEPEPQDSPSPSPSPDDPEPSPTPTEDPGDGSDDGDDADAPDDGEASDDGAAGQTSQTTRSSGQAARPPAQRVSPSDRAEGDADAAAVADPDVAPPEPDFEPFPTPSPVDASPTPEIDDDLAVDIPPPGGIPRSTLILIAFATLAATLGAFAKVVLFGGSWG